MHSMWWMRWRALVHYVVDDVASINALRLYAVDDVASTGILCGWRRGVHRYTMRWMTWQAPVH